MQSARVGHHRPRAFGAGRACPAHRCRWAFLTEQGGTRATSGGRLARTTVLAASSSLLACIAHSVSDGCVDVVGALLTAAGISGVAWALVGQRRTLPTVLGWLSAVQLIAHLTLAATCRDSAGTAVSLADTRARYVLFAHAAAVDLTAVVLQRTDAALSSLPVLPHGFTSRVRRALQLLTASPVPLPPKESGYLPRHPVRLTPSRQAPPPTGTTSAPAERRTLTRRMIAPHGALASPGTRHAALDW